MIYKGQFEVTTVVYYKVEANSKKEALEQAKKKYFNEVDLLRQGHCLIQND